MKAALYRRYGAPDVVALAEVPTPAPADDEILIRIHAATVSAGDFRARSLEMPRGFGPLARPVFGFTGPRRPILGTECAGTVEAVGRAVTRFRPGDAVFAFPGAKFGCHAEYRTIRADGMVFPMPSNLSFEEAAALSFGGTTALHFLVAKGGLRRGERLLVVGASGSVGSAAVQIAKHLGAHVTGVASTRNLALVESLGADAVIDYTAEDFAASGKTWDVILDTTGTAPYARSAPALAPGGRLLIVAGSLGAVISAGIRPRRGNGHRVIAGVAPERPEDLATLASLAGSGALRPLIDRSFPLAEAAAAHAAVATGRKRGNVVLTMV